MADTKEADPKRQEPAKRGLYGWKAALAVFGCGTFAAFGLFGLVVGVLSLIFSSLSSGVSSGGGQAEGQSVVPEQTIRARDELADGAIDLCGRTIPGADGSSVIRSDSGSDYQDPGMGSVPRVISDSCEWSLTPATDGSARWTMDFTYMAFAVDESGGPASDQASEEFNQRVTMLDEIQLAEKSDGAAGVADSSRFVHGISDVGTTVYVVVVRSGDTVYEMAFETSREFPDESLVPVGDFEAERDKITEFIEVRLGVSGP